MPKFKNLFWRVREKISQPFYAKPQTYNVNYQTLIKNNSSLKKELTVVLPLPPNTASQKLQSEIHLTPAGAIIKKDKLFGNQYALWQTDFEPQESRLYQLSFKISVSPIFSDLKKIYSLKEYQNIESEAKKFLFPSLRLQVNDPRIKNLAEEIKGKEDNVLLIIKKLNQYVISHLQYGRPISGLYSALDALNNKMVDCGGFSSLFVSLGRALGLPARIVSGFWAGWPKNEMHAWAEARLPDGQWIPADPSVEFLSLNGRTKKSGCLGFAGSDRIIFSFGCDIPIEIDDKTAMTDILQNPFLYSEEGLDDFKTEIKFKADKMLESRPPT